MKAKYWLMMNLTREGVIATESDLQYKALKESEGCKPDTD
jgi:hypothetical protein